MSMIKIEHLRKEYPNITPLKDVCVEINKGDVISIIGPSGTGKSTFLRCLNQLEQPTSGTVTFNGEVITDPKCRMEKIRQKMGMKRRTPTPAELYILNGWNSLISLQQLPPSTYPASQMVAVLLSIMGWRSSRVKRSNTAPPPLVLAPSELFS